MSGSKLKLNEIYAELSDLIGYENAIKVYEQYKGQQINFPGNLYDKTAVKEMIKEQYNGKNAKELARQYNYPERWVRMIVKQKKQKHTDDQLNL